MNEWDGPETRARLGWCRSQGAILPDLTEPLRLATSRTVDHPLLARTHTDPRSAASGPDHPPKYGLHHKSSLCDMPESWACAPGWTIFGRIDRGRKVGRRDVVADPKHAAAARARAEYFRNLRRNGRNACKIRIGTSESRRRPTLTRHGREPYLWQGPVVLRHLIPAAIAKMIVAALAYCHAIRRSAAM